MAACICGSELPSRELYDARGIYVSRVCNACEARVRARYRPEIFWQDDYELDEPVEEEEE